MASISSTWLSDRNQRLLGTAAVLDSDGESVWDSRLRAWDVTSTCPRQGEVTVAWSGAVADVEEVLHVDVYVDVDIDVDDVWWEGWKSSARWEAGAGVVDGAGQ